MDPREPVRFEGRPHLSRPVDEGAKIVLLQSPPEILDGNRDFDVWPITRVRQGQPVTAPLQNNRSMQIRPTAPISIRDPRY